MTDMKGSGREVGLDTAATSGSSFKTVGMFIRGLMEDHDLRFVSINLNSCPLTPLLAYVQHGLYFVPNTSRLK